MTSQSGLMMFFSIPIRRNYKLSYAATAKDTIYMGRSDFYILPGMFELTDPDYGNPKLLPAYGRTSSIGYTRAFSDRNLFTLNWFYTKGERTIGFDDDGKYQNYTNDVSRGWNAQWNPTLDSHWQMNLGWAICIRKLTEIISPRDISRKTWLHWESITIRDGGMRDWTAFISCAVLFLRRKKDGLPISTASLMRA